jgi:two-component system response regulator DevR
VLTNVFVKEKFDAYEHQAEGSKMTLFIAETNVRVRQRLASIAAGVEGITVAGEAGDVEKAIVGIKRAKPDSVIVALPLSGGNGLDVLSAAKSSNPASVAIMLSQGACGECEHRCFALGAEYFYEKSSEMKKIITTLVLLAHRSSQQGLGESEGAVYRIAHPLPKPSEQTESFPFSVPANCPRFAESPASNASVCLLARR